MSVNKVILIGRLGKDPEVKQLPSNKTVATFSIATDEGFGEKKTTAWHRIVAWEKTAELAGKYLEKGKEVYIEGRLQYREYEKDGEKKYITEIVAERMTFIGSGGKSEEKPKAATRDADEVPY